jgi:hypothetical protein
MKKIQRIIDNQYLVDASKDVWTNNIEEARAYRSGELIVAKVKLFNKGVKPEDIKEI